MSAAAVDETDLQRLLATLRGLDLFVGIDEDTIALLADGIQLRRLAPGETLFAEGDASDGMAIVLAGRLRLTRLDGSGRPRPVADVGRGEVVGEMGVLSDQPRSATATASRETTLGVLGGGLVRDVVLRRPESLLHLARTLVDRVDRGDPPGWSPVHTIAVLPAGGTPPERAREVLDELATALARYGSTARLASTDAASALPGDAGLADSGIFDAPALRQWVEGVEGTHEHVLLDGTDVSPWAEWCLRFADAVLVVAQSDADPRVGPVERGLWVAGQAAHHVELVVVHEPSTMRPTGTARWLAERKPAGVHHVRRASAGDHARLARLISGHGIGLVLGGGGPRGFAHLGVMRALDEAGLPVDLVGGTSIGAIMGGFLALGLDHEQRMRVAHEAFVRPDLVRYTLPLVSLSSAREVTAGLRRHFGETLIEDLWLRFLCVSVDLVAGEEVVHERGSVWHATRASISLPAVFPPVVDGERMLVDGGILNNTPVDHVASRLAGGTLIAVDLDNAGDAATEILPFPPDLSGWTVLRDRLAPGRPVAHMPGPIETLLRSRSVIAARVQRDIFATTRPDLHIHPRMGSHGLVDFRTAPQFVEAGYRATLEALENAPIRVP